MDLRIDLTKIPVRRDSDHLELSTPYNKANEVEASKSARDERLPPVTSKKAPSTAREGSDTIRSGNAKEKRSKPEAKLKRVDLSPFGNDGPASLFKEGLEENSQLEGGSSVMQSGYSHIEDFTQSIHAAGSPESTGSPRNSFPSRRILKRHDNSGLPDHILLSRQRSPRTERDFASSSAAPASSRISAAAQMQAQDHGFEPLSPRGDSAGRGFSSDIALETPTKSRAGQIMFISSNDASPAMGSPRSTPAKVDRYEPAASCAAAPATPAATSTPPVAHTAGSIVNSTSTQAGTGAQGGNNNHPGGRNVSPRRGKEPHASVQQRTTAGAGVPGSLLHFDATVSESASQRGDYALGLGLGEGSITSSEKGSVLRVRLPSAPRRGTPPTEPSPADHPGQSNNHPCSNSSANSAAGVTVPFLTVTAAIGEKQKKPTPVLINRFNLGQTNEKKPTYAPRKILFAHADVNTPAGSQESISEHELERDLSMHLSFQSVIQVEEAKKKSMTNKVKSPSEGESGKKASMFVQELVAPSMPIVARPHQMKHVGVKHRNLMARLSNQPQVRIPDHRPQPIPFSDSPGKDLQSYLSEGSPLKRRVVNDTLSGTRTSAVTGGMLLQYAGQADFHALQNATAEVSAAMAQFTEQSTSPNSSSSSPQHNATLEFSPERGAPLSPDAEAAIAAARTATEMQLRIPHVLTPHAALEAYPTYFSPAEKVEILNYSQIYFMGLHKSAKASARGDAALAYGTTAQAPTPAQSFNDGYDTSEGNYIAPTGDHLRFRYEVLNLLGRGSFGEVYRCRDHKSGVDVAVKVIRNKPIFNAQADKELDVLQRTSAPSEGSAGSATHGADRRHQHYMIQLLDSFQFRNHKCLVFPVCGKTLYEYLQDKNFAGLPMSFVRRVGAQLFAALAHMKRLQVIHCDIKPENILLREEGTAEVVLIDFGSSCLVSEQAFTYIQSRFYRAPEVLLGMPYGVEIDLWSVAAILPELRTAYPVFPGESGVDQVACIAEVLGLPPREFVERSSRRERHFDSAGDLLAKYSPRGQLRVPSSRSMESVCNARRRDADFVDLLTRCLQWLPEQRITVEECLAHLWLQPDNSSRYTTGTNGAEVQYAGGATLSAMTYSESRPDSAEDSVPRKGSQPGVTVPGIPLLAPAPMQTIVVPRGIASEGVVSRDPMMSLHLTPVE